jgi:hypothetical protein
VFSEFYDHVGNTTTDDEDVGNVEYGVPTDIDEVDDFAREEPAVTAKQTIDEVAECAAEDRGEY